LRSRLSFLAADLYLASISADVYLLGLTVVRELAKKYGLQEMINWNINQASEQVVGALQELLK
jgi:hypothetical protein